MSRSLGSLRTRIFILLLLASLLPIALLSAVIAREARGVMTLWQPTRLSRSIAFSIEAQRALLESQGRLQGEMAIGLLSGIETGVPPADLRVERIPQIGEGPLAAAVAGRLPSGPPGDAGPEPPYRIFTVPRPGEDLLIAAARAGDGDGTQEGAWALVGKGFPPETFRRLEDLGRDLGFLRRLEDVTAVAGNALVFVLLVIAVLAAAAASLLATLLARSVTRPIERLADAMNELGRTETLRRVEPQGAREVRLLAESFNRLQGQLRDARVRLAATERSLGFRDSARHVAHEMKNALTPILSALGVLRPHLAPSPEAPPRRALELIEGEAARLERLADGFSQMGRLPPPRPKRVDAIASLRRILHLHLPSTIACRAVEPSDGDPSPGGGARRLVFMDPDALDQVWVNLVKNAAEAMPEGGDLVIDVRTDGGPGEGRIEIAMTDTGPGLPPGGESPLFRQGFTTKAQGSGLGLYISRLLLRAAGGDLVLEPGDGGGARARVTLPLAGTGGSEDP